MLGDATGGIDHSKLCQRYLPEISASYRVLVTLGVSVTNASLPMPMMVLACSPMAPAAVPVALAPASDMMKWLVLRDLQKHARCEIGGNAARV